MCNTSLSGFLTCLRRPKLSVMSGTLEVLMAKHLKSPQLLEVFTL